MTIHPLKWLPVFALCLLVAAVFLNGCGGDSDSSAEETYEPQAKLIERMAAACPDGIQQVAGNVGYSDYIVLVCKSGKPVTIHEY